MTEEKKEGSCCSSHGSGCCKGVKLIVALLLGGFIFLSGMWFAKAHCHSCHMGGGFCPFSAPQTAK
jgi:hypothetical protein